MSARSGFEKKQSSAREFEPGVHNGSESAGGDPLDQGCLPVFCRASSASGVQGKKADKKTACGRKIAENFEMKIGIN